MAAELNRGTNRGAPILFGGVLVIAIALLIRSIWISLSWPMEIDTPLLHYMAFAVDSGVVPYRDLFVTSFPGAILFHIGIIRMVGTGEQAFMLVNLVWLLAVIFATWKCLAPLGHRVALAGGILFGLVYLHGGPYIALQRDAVLILPIACATWLGLAERGSTRWRALSMGLLFGLAATIKPHAAIGLPFILWLGNYRNRDGEERGAAAFVRRTAFASVGFALPLVAVYGWLVSTGGSDAFFEMVATYLPLHLELSGHHEELVGAARWLHLFKRTIDFGPESAWLIAAVPGWLIVVSTQEVSESAKRTLRLFGTLAIVYALYPALAGQFWNYHWLPFEYFAAQLAAFCLLDPQRLHGNALLRFTPVLLLIAALHFSDAAFPPPATEAPTAAQLSSKKRLSKRVGYHHRVFEIGSFLESELEPNDRVQPLDWVGGGVHAMLVAQAQIATPFVSDYHFYHHVDHPYVRGLRERFLTELKAEPPRFIVEILDIPRPKDGDFKPLMRWIKRNYVSAKEGRSWVVWEHELSDR